MKFYHAYKWLMPSLIFSTVLIILRAIHTKDIYGMFLCWNLFLALLPLYFSYKARHSLRLWVTLLWMGLWLLFFPNAIYIITDIFHLDDNAKLARWFSLVLLTSAALNGLIYGLLSLRNIELRLRKIIPAQYIRFIIFGLLLLCGYGIYLGRYLRWNSWDIIASPIALGSDIAQHLIHPFRHAHIWQLTLVFAVWMYILYVFIGRWKKV